ncbi:Nuclease [Andreprevotia sp. IGB-42]|uniref:DNA/RNA non-specific endonuclease n=1 Tax=Andreprevotia sp. IGB-42 TaxID=2497473 RepID=UPI001359B927|nr:DNA/RNA non-specific endonuclease [Andreprevotia sp. IGB-42]KAF0813923.1 Nuclease [Andreprevotia sp. IGB-42]
MSIKVSAVLLGAVISAAAVTFTPIGRHYSSMAVAQLAKAEAALSGHVPVAKPGRTSAQAGAFAACPQFFYGGTPPEVPNAAVWQPRALCFSAFAVYHAGLSHTPLFVAERLNKAQLLDAKDEQRTNRFYADARLPAAERANLDDYKSSGYDRGHMAPAGDMPTPEAMAQSFSLANMVPQAPDNNRGVWAKSVEKAVRKYVMRAAGDVYVITGPVFADKQSADANMQRVWVPSALYKLVYDPMTNKAWAYWLENRNDARLNGVISYKELVERTGMNLLPQLQRGEPA